MPRIKMGLLPPCQHFLLHGDEQSSSCFGKKGEYRNEVDEKQKNGYHLAWEVSSMKHMSGFQEMKPGLKRLPRSSNPASELHIAMQQHPGSELHGPGSPSEHLLEPPQAHTRMLSCSRHSQ